MSAPTPATQPVKTKSKAYSSTVAIQGDAAKYRLKYKELKKKVREIEVENDKLHLKTLGIKRNIQRMRLERAILYERLEAESQATPSAAAYPPPLPPPAAGLHHYDLELRREDPYASGAGSSSGAAARGGDYSGYGGSASGGAGSGAYRQSAASTAVAGERSRVPYASAYDDYPPPPPPRSHPHTVAHHSRPYPTSTSSAAAPAYDSSHHSPQPPPPTSSTGDRAERLRQYTESPSPEPTRRDADTPPMRLSADPSDAGASARSGIKVTLRRGA